MFPARPRPPPNRWREHPHRRKTNAGRSHRMGVSLGCLLNTATRPTEVGQLAASIRAPHGARFKPSKSSLNCGAFRWSVFLPPQ